MKSPAKLVEKSLREHGARPDGRDARCTFWRFGDNRVVAVNTRITQAQAARLLEDVEARYPAKRRGPGLDGVNVTPPVLDLARVEASPHAVERLHEMRTQRPIEWTTVLTALRAPARVVHSTRHDSWAWVGPVVTVCMRPHGAGWVITTVLWSDGHLWDQHPRKEKRQA